MMTVFPGRSLHRMRQILSVIGVSLGLSLVLNGCFSGVTQQRGVPGTLRDSELREEVRAAWLAEDPLINSYVNLEIFQGRLMMTGAVPTETLRDEAVAVAFRIDGVREVLNEIEVAPAPSIGRSARDSLIITHLRSDLLIDKQVNSQNYALEATGGTVYILGSALSQAEMDRVIDHARTLSNVRKVVNYVRLQSGTLPPAAGAAVSPTATSSEPVPGAITRSPGPVPARRGQPEDDDIVRDPDTRPLSPVPVQAVPLK